MTKRLIPLLILLCLLGSCAPVPAIPTSTPTAPALAALTSTPIATPKPIMASTTTDEPPPTPDLPADRLSLPDFANVNLADLPTVDHNELFALCTDVVDNSPLDDTNPFGPVQFIVQGRGYTVVMTGRTGKNLLPVFAVNEGGMIKIIWAATLSDSDGINQSACIVTAHPPIFDKQDGVQERNISMIPIGNTVLSVALIIEHDTEHGDMWDELLTIQPNAQNLSTWILDNQGQPILATNISP